MMAEGVDQSNQHDGVSWLEREWEQDFFPYCNWNAGIGAPQPYCDTMHHTHFYPQKSPVAVQVIVCTVAAV